MEIKKKKLHEQNIWVPAFHFLDIYPGVELLDHMVILFLMFWGNIILCSSDNTVLNIPTKSIQIFQILHKFANN